MPAGTSGFFGVGNELANTITGRPGNDELYGWGENADGVGSDFVPLVTLEGVSAGSQRARHLFHGRLIAGLE